MQLLWYDKCSTCQRIKKILNEQGINVTTIDVKKDKITSSQISTWYKNSKQELKKFLNSSGLVYKSLNLKENLKNYSQEEIINLLAENTMLIKRPILIMDSNIYIQNQIIKNLETIKKYK